MPFKKVGKNKNVSPSGKVFTDKQVKLYYATDGFKDMDEDISEDMLFKSFFVLAMSRGILCPFLLNAYCISSKK